MLFFYSLCHFAFLFLTHDLEDLLMFVFLPWLTLRVRQILLLLTQNSLCLRIQQSNIWKRNPSLQYFYLDLLGRRRVLYRSLEPCLKPVLFFLVWKNNNNRKYDRDLKCFTEERGQHWNRFYHFSFLSLTQPWWLGGRGVDW